MKLQQSATISKKLALCWKTNWARFLVIILKHFFLDCGLNVEDRTTETTKGDDATIEQVRYTPTVNFPQGSPENSKL